ncbi:sulfur carrier protein ThiS [Acerihabitans sp. TG2]|uniref:sulfur carrier protein ThiS n=1 Tax=Acerihabitans sp. TG2 TaxID=3096008 RepID=UPI002B23D261|nr:sulfur carrier protein ThiS [Acerihabitans sp. TG2]MEA9393345.1 sulfur carrier protein ThiS [Acerihabitans sp. TG2]
MKINVNDHTVELDAPLTLAALVAQWTYSSAGTALAINHIIIPRDQWPQHWVNEGDDILLFQAIAGG